MKLQNVDLINTKIAVFIIVNHHSDLIICINDRVVWYDSVINQLTPLIFFRVLNFFQGDKMGVPPKNFAFFLLLSHDNRQT